MKELAQLSSIPYTTLASMMSRRPEKIAKNTLANIARVFGLEWYKLLGREMEFGPIKAYEHRNINGERISAMLDEAMAHQVLKNIIGENYKVVISCIEREKKTIIERPDNLERVRPRDIRSQFKACVDLVFDNLNEAGVIEAMRYMLELSQNPHYCISTDSHTSSNTKEDEPCQENEP